MQEYSDPSFLPKQTTYLHEKDLHLSKLTERKQSRLQRPNSYNHDPSKCDSTKDHSLLSSKGDELTWLFNKDGSANISSLVDSYPNNKIYRPGINSLNQSISSKDQKQLISSNILMDLPQQISARRYSQMEKGLEHKAISSIENFENISHQEIHENAYSQDRQLMSQEKDIEDSSSSLQSGSKARKRRSRQERSNLKGDKSCLDSSRMDNKKSAYNSMIGLSHDCLDNHNSQQVVESAYSSIILAQGSFEQELNKVPNPSSLPILLSQISLEKKSQEREKSERMMNEAENMLDKVESFRLNKIIIREGEKAGKLRDTTNILNKPENVRIMENSLQELYEQAQSRPISQMPLGIASTHLNGEEKNSLSAKNDVNSFKVFENKVIVQELLRAANYGSLPTSTPNMSLEDQEISNVSTERRISKREIKPSISLLKQNGASIEKERTDGFADSYCSLRGGAFAINFETRLSASIECSREYTPHNGSVSNIVSHVKLNKSQPSYRTRSESRKSLNTRTRQGVCNSSRHIETSISLYDKDLNISEQQNNEVIMTESLSHDHKASKVQRDIAKNTKISTQSQNRDTKENIKTTSGYSTSKRDRLVPGKSSNQKCVKNHSLILSAVIVPNENSLEFTQAFQLNEDKALNEKTNSEKEKLKTDKSKRQSKYPTAQNALEEAYYVDIMRKRRLAEQALSVSNKPLMKGSSNKQKQKENKGVTKEQTKEVSAEKQRISKKGSYSSTRRLDLANKVQDKTVAKDTKKGKIHNKITSTRKSLEEIDYGSLNTTRIKTQNKGNFLLLLNNLKTQQQAKQILPKVEKTFSRIISEKAYLTTALAQRKNSLEKLPSSRTSIKTLKHNEQNMSRRRLSDMEQSYGEDSAVQEGQSTDRGTSARSYYNWTRMLDDVLKGKSLEEVTKIWGNFFEKDIGALSTRRTDEMEEENKKRHMKEMLENSENILGSIGEIKEREKSPVKRDEKVESMINLIETAFGVRKEDGCTRKNEQQEINNQKENKEMKDLNTCSTQNETILAEGINNIPLIIQERSQKESQEDLCEKDLEIQEINSHAVKIVLNEVNKGTHSSNYRILLTLLREIEDKAARKIQNFAIAKFSWTRHYNHKDVEIMSKSGQEPKFTQSLVENMKDFKQIFGNINEPICTEDPIAYQKELLAAFLTAYSCLKNKDLFQEMMTNINIK